MDKKIIATSHADAGLCNKLKCLISGMRIADKIGEKCSVYWATSWQCGAEFEELFRTEIPILDKSLFDKLKKDAVICKTYNDFNKVIAGETIASNVIFDNWRFILIPGDVEENFAKIFPDKDTNGMSIDLEYENIPEKLRNDILKYVRKIKPVGTIEHDVNEIVIENDNFKNVVGIHARRAEFILTSDGRGKVSTDEKFFARMDELLKEDENTKFFLATDSKETEDAFRNKYGDKILSLPNKNWDKASKESTINALMDLLLLSKTKRLLGTYMSTFSEMAWWFSGCKILVEIPGDEGAKKKVIEIQMNIKERNFVSRNIREMVRVMRRKSKIARWAVEKVTAMKK